MTVEASGGRWMRVLASVVGIVAITLISSLLSSYLVTKQLASLLKPQTDAATFAPDIPGESVVDVDFYKASGIDLESLRKFLAEMAAHDHLNEYPAHLTFENEAGDCLVDHPVAVSWNSGRDVVKIGQAGVLRIMLRPDLLNGLKFQVPQSFHRLKQHTIPLGTAYEPYAPPPKAGLGRHVVNDYEVSMDIWRRLARQSAAGEGLDGARWREQMLRRHCDRTLPAAHHKSEHSMSAAEIFRDRRASVVVVGHLLKEGGIVHAAGVVLDSDGVIATAYHVVDKPTAVARCVMTADGRAYPIQEILAADPANDVAIFRVAAKDLPAAPLSPGDDEGTPLTIVSHPAGEFYSVTQGHLRRFQTGMFLGKQVVRMAVTADFTDGSSGGPVFNDRGEVAGIVSLQHPTTANLSSRIAAPARVVRNLFRPSEP